MSAADLDRIHLTRALDLRDAGKVLWSRIRWSGA